jgi:hypothetical protein
MTDLERAARALAADDVANGAARVDQIDRLTAAYVRWLGERAEAGARGACGSDGE